MLEMFEQSRDLILSTISQYVDDRKEHRNIFIAEHTPRTLGSYDNSDLIFVFRPEKELAVLAERLHKKDYSWLQWQLIRMKIARKVNRFKSSDLHCSYVVHRDYLDITFYRGWWYEWAESSSL